MSKSKHQSDTKLHINTTITKWQTLISNNQEKKLKTASNQSQIWSSIPRAEFYLWFRNMNMPYKDFIFVKV